MKQIKKIGIYSPILILSLMGSMTYARCIVVPNGDVSVSGDIAVVETVIFQHWGNGESTAYPVATPKIHVECLPGTSAQVSLNIAPTSLDPWLNALNVRPTAANIVVQHEYNAIGYEEDTGESIDMWGRITTNIAEDRIIERQNATSERLDNARIIVEALANPRYIDSGGWLLRPPAPLQYRYFMISYWPTGNRTAANTSRIFGDNRLVLEQRLDPCNTNNMTVTVSPQIVDFGAITIKQGSVEVRRPFSITYQQKGSNACEDSIVGNIKFEPNGTYNGTAMRLSNGFNLSLVKSPNDTPITYGMPSRVQSIPPGVGSSMPRPIREEYIAVLKKDANVQAVDGPFNASIRYIFEIL